MKDKSAEHVGLVVNVLAFYSDNPSSNPAEVYSFSLKCCLKRTKINKKRSGLAHLTKLQRYYRSYSMKVLKVASNSGHSGHLSDCQFESRHWQFWKTCVLKNWIQKANCQFYRKKRDNIIVKRNKIKLYWIKYSKFAILVRRAKDQNKIVTKYGSSTDGEFNFLLCSRDWHFNPSRATEAQQNTYSFVFSFSVTRWWN